MSYSWDRPPDRITPEIVKRAFDDPNVLWYYLLARLDERPVAQWAEYVAALPRGLQIVNWFVMFDGEILNGCIWQVFGNHSEAEVNEMLRALDAIGATETAAQLCSAMEMLKTKPSAFWGDERDAWVDSTLNAINRARCTQEGSERDWNRLVDYMREHPHEFLHSPD